MTEVCSVEGCTRPHKSRGFCGTHYNQRWRSGVTETCSVDGCDKPAKVLARALCSMHYARWIRHGDTTAVRPNPPARRAPADRFWEKVDQSGDCWIWTAARSRNGYGRFGIGARRTVAAHRFAYEQLVGPIPDGLDLDHLCRTRACVRPDHLEPVTRSENLLRGYAARRSA